MALDTLSLCLRRFDTLNEVDVHMDARLLKVRQRCHSVRFRFDYLQLVLTEELYGIYGQRFSRKDVAEAVVSCLFFWGEVINVFDTPLVEEFI